MLSHASGPPSGPGSGAGPVISSVRAPSSHGAVRKRAVT